MANEDIQQIRNAYLKLKGGVFNFKGSSMEPVLKEGDAVKIVPVTRLGIKAGDIVIFNRDVLVCHRILGKFRKDNRQCFLEKGDNSDMAGHVYYEDIIGKVKYIITKNGLRKPPSLICGKSVLFFMLDILMSIYMEFADFLKNKLFSGRNNKFFRFFGAIIWRVYYFYFKLTLKYRSNTAAGVFFP